MKKNYLKLSGLSLAIALLISSCMPEVETPLTNEAAKLANEVADAGNQEIGGENLRNNSSAYNYSESFSNQLFQVDYDGENPFGISYFPGRGKGMANRMGKATSYINQLAVFDLETNGLITVSAPVTQFFGEELNALGLSNIPDEVSSLTTDGKGNAIWFKNIKNITTTISPELTQFEADVEVIGGNGRFSKARGQGVVKGTFNPTTGMGSSVLEARIDY